MAAVLNSAGTVSGYHLKQLVPLVEEKLCDMWLRTGKEEASRRKIAQNFLFDLFLDPIASFPLLFICLTLRNRLFLLYSSHVGECSGDMHWLWWYPLGNITSAEVPYSLCTFCVLNSTRNWEIAFSIFKLPVCLDCTLWMGWGRLKGLSMLYQWRRESSSRRIKGERGLTVGCLCTPAEGGVTVGQGPLASVPSGCTAMQSLQWC